LLFAALGLLHLLRAFGVLNLLNLLGFGFTDVHSVLRE
jgi:hypothetical protein